MADFDRLVAEARACFPSRVIGSDPTPRFESFHAPSSICSEKVRCVLMVKGLSFVAHEVDLTQQKNYNPAYVALRAEGGKDLALVGGSHTWTGSTAASDSGFDPLVVPTLVDNLKKRVIVDSLNIMNYIDQEVPEPPLYPESCRALAKKHSKLVDATPHAGLLYGGDPDNDTRPAFIQRLANGMVKDQVSAVNKWLESGKLPQELIPLYKAKLAKFGAVKTTLGSGPEQLRKSMDKTKEYLHELEMDLGKSSGPWICGEDLTMADIAWHVSLLRFLTFGCAYLWDGLPNVSAYMERSFAHPLLKSATFTWPGYLPSPHLSSLLKKEAGLVAAEKNRAAVVLVSMVSGPDLGVRELAKYLLSGGMGSVFLATLAAAIWIGGQ